MKKTFRIIGLIILAIILLIGASALSNIGLPQESQETAALSANAKAHLGEMFHLRSELGDEVWPGWGEAEIPVITYNEEYAFLVGYEGEPAQGWLSLPDREQAGGPWTPLSGDRFFGATYDRQPLPHHGPTPENFTVLVGEQWTATLMTREYAEVHFYQTFKEDLPAFLQPILPYRLIWKIMMGSTDTYIEGLAHESFHAFQGQNAPGKLSAAERIARLEDEYPWDHAENEELWKEEAAILSRAVQASSSSETLTLTQQFLEIRQERRSLPTMTSKMIAYEQGREWLEGLAKYAELSLGLTAYQHREYQPLASIQEDPDFKAYQNQDRFWTQQMKEIKRQGSQKGETRFYYTGMAQALLLDQIAPGWKDRAWAEDLWLDDLLAEAVSEQSR
jgi:hypothetical protein